MKAAGVYSRLGWRLIPIHSVTDGACSCARGAECPSAGKHPRPQAWQDEATDDLDQLREWAAQWPGSNLGVATGHGFFVLDIDPKNGGAVADLPGELPETVQASTPSGGSHYLFQMPDFPVSNRTHVWPGVDIRGTGGQIVIAPSRTAKGVYRWVRRPWEHEIAPAPDWLLAELQRSPALPDAAPAGDRGFFPAASQVVLDAAAVALEQHGPAVEGEGGDDHTFRAAALLIHDFALTDDEAWPLLCEWNQTCQPPWGEGALRAKLKGGGKYGRAEYGCKRSMDAIETARKLITDWDRTEPAMWPLIESCRKMAQRSGDPSKRAVILRELQAATGFNPRELALPQPAALADVVKPAGAIQVTTELHKVADESIAAIEPSVFQRNGVLCEVVNAPDRVFISELETPRIQDLMSQAAKFVRVDDKGLVAQVAPERVAAMLHSRRTHKKVRVIEAITTAPVFLADGTILQTRGYNAQARLWLEPSVAVEVPDEPTWENANGAAQVFGDLLQDFDFAAPGDFSSWLAGLLSPLVKAATSNAPAPLICVSASSPGAGKTLLTDLIARIVTGGAAEVRPYNPKDPGEWGKRLTAFVKAAAPVSVFDNCNGPIGDEGLDRLITSSTWSDRILGASDAPPLPNVTTWLATGNNIEPQGDTVRRVLLCRIEVATERPQERVGFRYDPIIDHAQDHRSELLSAALTMLRAYHVAGRPTQNLPSWGSFTTWSALVRGAIVWSGLADPFDTQRRASMDLNEPENERHDFWLGVIEASADLDGYAGAVVNAANQRDAETVLGIREQLTTYSLKKFLGRFIDKPRAGKRIRRELDAKRNQTRYFVEMI